MVMSGGKVIRYDCAWVGWGDGKGRIQRGEKKKEQDRAGEMESKLVSRPDRTAALLLEAEKNTIGPENENDRRSFPQLVAAPLILLCFTDPPPV